MTSQRLQRNITALDVLSKASRKQREAFINTATNDQISCICDCANNILIENIPLTESDLKKLKRYESFIRYLAENRGKRNYKEKKEYLIQEGGFLPVLLAPILSAAASILAETLINKK